MNENAGQREMPRYISQKTVWALCIASVEVRAANGHVLHFTDPGYAPIHVTDDWLQKHNPAVGGFYVVYRDGYSSYSPAQPFVDGNTPASQWGISRAQEPKYTVGERGRLVNRISGKPIPDEEPVFILRAQDKLAMQVLQQYHRLVSDTGQHAGSIEERILAFSAFADAFPERMKYPNVQVASLVTGSDGSESALTDEVER